jgi:two-component system NtrC family sensor kinase
MSRISSETTGSAPAHDKEVASLKVITAGQRTGEDIQQTQLRMVKGIREIFEAEDALMILFDEQDPALVIKKQLGAGDDWQAQTSQQIEPGILYRAAQQGACVAVSDVSAYEGFNPFFDAAPNIATRAYLCAPVRSNGLNFGALALVNPPARLLTAERVDLFQMLTLALANALYNARLLMQLRISSADLEASRWELLHSRNTLRALVDNLPSSIYIVDQNYTIIAINMSRVRRQGDKPNQLVGRKCFEKLYGRATPCSDCLVAETFATAESTSRIKREHMETGLKVEWEINTFPISNGPDLPAQTIITEYDVTEKRMLEADLMQSEKLAAIGQLAAGMAHEIYNPLTAIIANAQMIRRQLPKVDGDVYESLDLIEHAGIRASQVIRSLLNAARKEDLENAPVDLNETIENALALLNHELIKRPAAIKKSLQADMPPVYASQNHLQSVWVNLLMNALDAVEHIEGRILVSSAYADGAFRVTFRDNGRGIPKEKLSRVFEPYFTTKQPGRGTGLGLAMCMRVIKQHGGTIHVESQPEQGACFTVTLPETNQWTRPEVE